MKLEMGRYWLEIKEVRELRVKEGILGVQARIEERRENWNWAVLKSLWKVKEMRYG